MNDRIITNMNKVDEFLEEIMQNEDIESGRGLVEEKWIKTVLKKYIQNDYPFVTPVVRKSKDELYFRVSLTKKFEKQISNILYYFEFLVDQDKSNKEKILKLSFDVALKKAEQWVKGEEEKTAISNKEYKEKTAIWNKEDREQGKKELLSLKDLEQTFNSLKGSKEDLRVLTKWSENLYLALNKKLFKNKLKLPLISVRNNLKVKGVSGITAVFGVWSIKSNLIGINTIAFNKSFLFVKTLMAHEMCHQAVSDISKIDDINDPRDGYDVGGHGSEWIKWMESCNLKPNRFFDYIFHDEFDYYESLTTDRNLDQEALNKGEKPFNRQLKKYELVKFTHDGWKIGMAVADYQYKSHEVCNVIYKNKGKYTRSPFMYEDLWKVSPKYVSLVEIKEMKKLVDELLEESSEFSQEES